MDMIYAGIELKTLSPLHHGYTEPQLLESIDDNGDDSDDKKTFRLVRQIRILLPDQEKSGAYYPTTVPVLGGNAIRGRLRRALAYGTLGLLGLNPQNPGDLTVPNLDKTAFHTLTSGGTLVSKNTNSTSSPWVKFPLYRYECLQQWPLLSLFGFALQDFMQPSKLRISFGWPLIEALRPVISLDVDGALFPGVDANKHWARIAPQDLIVGDRTHPHDLHYEYKHADDDVIAMPETSQADTKRKVERAGMVMAYQYVPINVPFGFRVSLINPTDLEAAALRWALEQAFPFNQPIVFGGHSTTGMGLMKVTRHSGLDSETLADPAQYQAFIHDHRDMLIRQLVEPHQFFRLPDREQHYQSDNAESNVVTLDSAYAQLQDKLGKHNTQFRRLHKILQGKSE